MELRKIQMTGGSSFTVTLPKDWVKEGKMSPGDVVGFVKQSDGSLAIYPHARLAPAHERFDVEIEDEDFEHAFRRIIAAYLAGYDVIAVRSKKPLTGATRRAIQQAAKRIIGIEIVDDELNTVVLRDFLDAREFPMEKGLRRMSTLARAMQEDALRAFRDDRDDLEQSLQDRDDEVDRLYWMINKQYHGVLRDPSYAQKMGLNSSQALNYLMVARLVERVADHAMRIAENVQALRAGGSHSKLESKMEKQAKRAVLMFAESIAAFHKQDAKEANRIIEDAKAFGSAQDAAIRESLSLGGADIVHVAYALESIGRTAAYAADVAETAINHKVAMRPQL
jgi:phosphate uptake regulator